MIVYDKTIVQNNDLLDEAQSLKKAGFIDKVQYDTIIKELVITKTHDNILVRALFFILGVFLYSSICGFLALISLEALDTNYEYLVFFFAIVGWQ